MQGARRKLARPVQPKEPLPVDTVCRIADHYISSSSLAVIRFLFILLFGFAGFFRMDEIRNLSVNDISICSEYMSVFIPKRKNDQYSKGNTSLLARSHKATCPVSITGRLLKLLPLSSISYTTLGEEFRKYVKPFVDHIARYGTHSIKSGAASNPACTDISGDLLDMHAGWKCANSKNRYIKLTVNHRLKVARSIAL